MRFGVGPRIVSTRRRELPTRRRCSAAGRLRHLVTPFIGDWPRSSMPSAAITSSFLEGSSCPQQSHRESEPSPLNRKRLVAEPLGADNKPLHWRQTVLEGRKTPRRCASTRSLVLTMPMCFRLAPSEPTTEYKQHRIAVSLVGKGWRASIFAPSATRPLTDSPCDLEKRDKHEIVAQAKRVIDAHLRP
jgi:hypothetical protein